MPSATQSDWNPETYARFSGLRLRPALDLLTQVGPLPEGDVVDLGCGAGAVGEALRARFPERRRIGLDNSTAMLARARDAGDYDDLIEANAALWSPARPPALIYSNALLHWLDDHDTLFPRLCDLLAPGGTLAVQMPRQYDAPSHSLLREIAVQMFPERFDFSGWRAPVHEPVYYQRLLAPFGAVQVWETTYLQVLAPTVSGHPVRAFTQSTAMRPFLAKLSQGEAERFTSRYDGALESAYKAEADGSVLFGFRRLFMTMKRDG